MYVYCNSLETFLLHTCTQEHAHTEDILCVAFDASHLMATASFDGEVCTLVLAIDNMIFLVNINVS